MTILSWNMLYRNREQDRAFAFISKSDFDIFCLQEVPQDVLARLTALPCSIASRIDVEKTYDKKTISMFNVILSKHPITSQKEIPFPEYGRLLPLRTRIFVQMMPARFFSEIRNRGGLFVDVTISDELKVRVFNLHLILALPAWRIKEFEMAMTMRDTSRPTIVCGDFNTLQRPHVTPLNWLLGGTVSDVALYNRERTRIERRFVEHQLTNPLSGGITHPISQSQLDHILLSNSFAIRKANVLTDRFGSDHYPIRVEFD